MPASSTHLRQLRIRPVAESHALRRRPDSAGQGSDSEVLLGRQSDGSGWDLPGNFLAATDMIEPALQRECRREMDVEVDVGELLGAYEDTFRGIAIVTLVYLCRVRAGEPRPADLIDEVRWFPIATPPPIAPAAGQRAVAEVRHRLGMLAERA